MSKLKSLSISIFVLCSLILSFAAQADESMNPPKPLENKMFDEMVGTWSGIGNMMGVPMHEVLKIHWALNHQYLVMDLVSTATAKPAMNYEGMGIFGVDAQGKVKSFWFDSWGVNAMVTGIGTTTDNKLVLQDSNAMFKETRSFEVKGNEMIMHAKGNMNWQGKQTPFDQTTVYKK